VICSISSLCDSEFLQLHSTVKHIFSWSKATDRWQGARLSEFFWQHSRRRHLVRLLVPASTGFQPNTEHPLFISSLHTQTALACVIHNTARSVPLDMNKLVRAAKLWLTFGRSLIWTSIRHRHPNGSFSWSSHSLHAKCRNCIWLNSAVAKEFHRQYKEI